MRTQQEAQETIYQEALNHEEGKGVPKDLKRAAELYKKAADQGSAEAQYKLAIYYNNGIGLKKDLKEAIRLYHLAAENGHAKAQNNLGVLYENGDGVNKDLKEAVRLYQLAAEKGNAEAQYNLGVCYENGDGLVSDQKEALRLYRLAAAQGDKDAQFGVGVCYENGLGVDKDLNEAEHWYTLAANQGHESAKERVESLTLGNNNSDSINNSDAISSNSFANDHIATIANIDIDQLSNFLGARTTAVTLSRTNKEHKKNFQRTIKEELLLEEVGPNVALLRNNDETSGQAYVRHNAHLSGIIQRQRYANFESYHQKRKIEIRSEIKEGKGIMERSESLRNAIDARDEPLQNGIIENVITDEWNSARREELIEILETYPDSYNLDHILNKDDFNSEVIPPVSEMLAEESVFSGPIADRLIEHALADEKVCRLIIRSYSDLLALAIRFPNLPKYTEKAFGHIFKSTDPWDYYRFFEYGNLDTLFDFCENENFAAFPHYRKQALHYLMQLEAKYFINFFPNPDSLNQFCNHFPNCRQVALEKIISLYDENNLDSLRLWGANNSNLDALFNFHELFPHEASQCIKNIFTNYVRFTTWFPNVNAIAIFLEKFPNSEVIKNLFLNTSYFNFILGDLNGLKNFQKEFPAYFEAAIHKMLEPNFSKSDVFTKMDQLKGFYKLVDETFWNQIQTAEKIKNQVLEIILENEKAGKSMSIFCDSRMFSSQGVLSDFCKEFPEHAKRAIDCILNNEKNFKRMCPNEIALHNFCANFPDSANKAKDIFHGRHEQKRSPPPSSPNNNGTIIDTSKEDKDSQEEIKLKQDNVPFDSPQVRSNQQNPSERKLKADDPVSLPLENPNSIRSEIIDTKKNDYKEISNTIVSLETPTGSNNNKTIIDTSTSKEKKADPITGPNSNPMGFFHTQPLLPTGNDQSKETKIAKEDKKSPLPAIPELPADINIDDELYTSTSLKNLELNQGWFQRHQGKLCAGIFGSALLGGTLYLTLKELKPEETKEFFSDIGNFMSDFVKNNRTEAIIALIVLIVLGLMINKRHSNSKRDNLIKTYWDIDNAKSPEIRAENKTHNHSKGQQPAETTHADRNARLLKLFNVFITTKNGTKKNDYQGLAVLLNKVLEHDNIRNNLMEVSLFIAGLSTNIAPACAAQTLICLSRENKQSAQTVFQDLRSVEKGQNPPLQLCDQIFIAMNEIDSEQCVKIAGSNTNNAPHDAKRLSANPQGPIRATA